MYNKANHKINIRNKSDNIDSVIKLLAFGSITGTMLVAPNAIQVLDKPLNFILDGLDDREKRRKIRRLRSYLKTQGLIKNDYEHGLILTQKGMKRLEKIEFDEIEIYKPKTWDKKWRLIMFDIPESERYSREQFVDKIKELGMQLLQQSVWVHPYHCKEEISKVAERFCIAEWITYIETSHIDNEKHLMYRFKQTLVL